MSVPNAASPATTQYRAPTGEDGVERGGELSGAVADQIAEPVIAFPGAEQVAGGLGGPRSGRVGRDAGEVDTPRSDFDDEQDVEPSQGCGVNACEVGGGDGGGLGADELDPRGPGPVESG